MAHKATESDKAIAKIMRNQGYLYTAAYIEMFGADNLNPNFWGAMNQKREEFYQKCVEEKHPWDYYDDPPDENAVL